MIRRVDRFAFWLGWCWLLRLLDKVAPRPGIGGPAPRISKFSEAEARRVEEILRRRASVEPRQEGRMNADRVAYRAQLRLTLEAEAEVRRLRDLMELAVTALLPVLPLRGSWESGYEVESVTSQVRALPEEWAEAAYATAELHAAIKDHVNQAFRIEDMMGGLPPVPNRTSEPYRDGR